MRSRFAQLWGFHVPETRCSGSKRVRRQLRHASRSSVQFPHWACALQLRMAYLALRVGVCVRVHAVQRSRCA